jgi:hypothetical protein
VNTLYFIPNQEQSATAGLVHAAREKDLDPDAVARELHQRMSEGGDAGLELGEVVAGFVREIRANRWRPRR